MHRRDDLPTLKSQHVGFPLANVRSFTLHYEAGNQLPCLKAYQSQISRSDIKALRQPLANVSRKQRGCVWTDITRAVHLDEDWLEVTIVDGGEQHIRIFKAGDAIDDVVGPMVNRRVTVDALRAPKGKHTFEDIQPVE